MLKRLTNWFTLIQITRVREARLNLASTSKQLRDVDEELARVILQIANKPKIIFSYLWFFFFCINLRQPILRYFGRLDSFNFNQIILFLHVLNFSKLLLFLQACKKLSIELNPVDRISGNVVSSKRRQFVVTLTSSVALISAGVAVVYVASKRLGQNWTI